MKQLKDQILKFGVVGILCFLIDFSIYTLLLKIIDWKYDYIIATVTGFTVSVIVNYLLSMKFIFVRKDDMDRKKEFVIFVVLSIIGCIINAALIFIMVDLMYENIAWISNLISLEFAKLFAKIVATGVVMVYNFVSRKLILEKKN